MRRMTGAVVSGISLICALMAASCDPGDTSAKRAAPPAWAYPVNPPPTRLPEDGGARLTVPGGSASFTLTEIRDLFSAPDWRPADHPAMPWIVAHGRRPNVRACGYCHLPTGQGRPENAPLAGLPAPYIIQQMADFKSGARRSSVPRRLPNELMASVASAVTSTEITAAAAYFSGLKPRSNVEVIESATVPRTVVKGWILTLSPKGGAEPLGSRIVETPRDIERFERRDSRVPIVAYVPVGAIARGAALVSGRGDGANISCTDCHGRDLRGVGNIPSLAGKSPSYIFRQLYDFRSGARSGATAQPMKSVVQRLDQTDMLDIAAYLASRRPR